MSSLFLPTVLGVGASGALYGMIGASLVDLLNNYSNLQHPRKELCGLIASIIFNLCLGLIPFVDNFAHIGGFIAGALTAVIVLPTISVGGNTKNHRLCNIITAFGLLVGLTAFGTFPNRRLRMLIMGPVQMCGCVCFCVLMGWGLGVYEKKMT